MRQGIGSTVYSGEILSSTANQEILDPAYLLSTYKFDVTESYCISFEVINEGDSDVTLQINRSNSQIVLPASYGYLDSKDVLQVKSCKIVESGKHVRFVAVLP